MIYSFYRLEAGFLELDPLVLREISGLDLRGLIKQEQYDAVVILYAQFMIGSHDKEANVNYKMFMFE